MAHRTRGQDAGLRAGRPGTMLWGVVLEDIRTRVVAPRMAKSHKQVHDRKIGPRTHSAREQTALPLRLLEEWTKEDVVDHPGSAKRIPVRYTFKDLATIHGVQRVRSSRG